MYVCYTRTKVHLNAKDKYEKNSSKDANIEQLCMCENKSALERDRSM